MQPLHLYVTDAANRFLPANCSIARTLDLVGEWWSLLIIREAFLGVTRYDDFQRRLGISRNALTDRLKKLVDGGVLTRQPVAEGARREEYVLTQMGDDLITVVVAMRQWGDRWLREPGDRSHTSSRPRPAIPSQSSR